MASITQSPQHPYWQTPIGFLKGVGPAKAKVLIEDAGIVIFWDLLCYFPYRYIDKSKRDPISAAHQDLVPVTVVGKLSGIRLIGEGKAKRLVAQLSDATHSIDLVWFTSIAYVQKFLTEGHWYTAYGKPGEFRGYFQMTHPELQTLEEAKTQSGIQAAYSSTEKMKNLGLDSKALAKLVQQLIQNAPPNSIPETLLPEYRTQYRLWPRQNAFYAMHLPQSFPDIEVARNTLKHEELLCLQFSVLQLKLSRGADLKGPVFESISNIFNTFYHKYLPFELTNAQKRVIREIRRDTLTGIQMNRLVQGDVGSGKTMVALLAMLMAIDNGYQACMMAPTEILARQHFESLDIVYRAMGLRVQLLTGTIKGKQRQQVLQDLANGQIHILVGTHALIEDPVQFQALGIAVIDEQHRFGVAQRAKLWKKADPAPHILVMTATPIPRTLAMTVYGDLDVSIIDELPPGRKPVNTVIKRETDRDEVNRLIAAEIAKGHQAYVVYSLIEESEKLDYKAVMDGYHQVSAAFPMPQYYISIVHGKLKQQEKEAEMKRFIDNATQIMVATTVIEVGVNVPNASVMVIENAEKFGLSQLHQLRGRVGRGAEQSYCILMTSDKISKDGRKRLQTMADTTDGFRIAEVDMEIRGPGDITGTQQSGLISFKIADLKLDAALLSAIRVYAEECIQQGLYGNQMPEMKRFVDLEIQQKSNWKSIS